LLRAFARDGKVVIAFCTEVSEVFDLADRVVVVDKGRLAGSLDVASYASVEALAADVSRLESRHGLASGAA
jgi:ABC-type sugar transport system ATPase subunit